jgi:uncharacterized protein YbjT (DUF2867 family)
MTSTQAPESNQRSQWIVVLGATGYVGGRLVSILLKDGYRVRACGRSLDKLKSRPWSHMDSVELMTVDVLDADSVDRVLFGAQAVYYLVHSMNQRSVDFAREDRMAAENTLRAAENHQVQHIIYLGGLGEQSAGLSKHLLSRMEVGTILQSGTVPVTVLRAAMIIGSGSASFEILRYLVERLPAMVTPKWVRTRNQPIAIRNVLGYLVGCLTVPETKGQTFDIGGPDILTYQSLMDLYAEVAGLSKRFVIPVPFLTPRLSSLWIHFVTPVPGYIARPLTEGLCNEVICHENSIRELIPQELLTCRKAIQMALNLVHNDGVLTYWADAGEIPEYAIPISGDPSWSGGTVLKDHRERSVNASLPDTWSVIARIGGKNGWYHGNRLWRLRGFLDKIVGGVGLRRGRRDPVAIAPGDVLDFWRVVSVKPNDHLLLAAEMKLPGIATLEFKLEPINTQTTRLIQTARFKPKGLFGILYWYSITVLHEYVFGGMIKKICWMAEGKHPKPWES